MSKAWEDQRIAAGLKRQMTVRRQVLEAGDVGIGWKVGFGAPSGLELMQIQAPLLGFLTRATVFESGVRIDTTGWNRGMVEFEVAVYLGKDLGPAASEAEAREAVAAVGPAIEIADLDLPLEAAGAEAILAGNMFHKGVVFGEPDFGRAGLNITDMAARILIDDRQVASIGDLQANPGSFPWIVTTVADTLAAFGERLQAGDVIITGSVIPPIPVTEGDRFTFALDPFDSISVEIEPSAPD